MTRTGKTPKRTPGRRNAGSSTKDPVEVYCRLRPLGDFDEDSCVEVLDNSTVQLNQPQNGKFQSSKIESLKCKFRHVFKEFVSQEEVFNSIGLPLVNDIIQGKNGLMFMYGITGSGKTHTMNGTPSDGGLLPRCLDTIFNSIGHVQAQRFTFKSDGHNGFDLLTSFEAKQEWARKEQELLVQTPMTTPRQNRRDNIADVVRIPDTTQLDVDEDNNYAVFISYVEIYNNFIYDLLDETPLDPICPKPPISKLLREDCNRSMFVYGGTEVEVKSTEEAYEVFWKGQSRRRVAHTQLNAESSRSHSVFTIRLVQAPLDSQGENLIQDRNLVAVSQLSLCDLAGSERTSRTQSEGDRLREAGNINSSLMTLRSCIESLRENQKAIEMGTAPRIVPYRDTKLTLFFKNFFDGDGKVRMIVCLNPRGDDFDESLHVVRFAEMTQEVRVARSDDVKFETGLTPGRGKANRFYKQALRPCSESETTDGYTDSDGQVADLIRPLETFNPFPPFKLNMCNDDTTLPNLINYLIGRAKKRESLLKELAHLQASVRTELVDGCQVNAGAARELESIKTSLTEKEREMITLEKRLRSVSQKTTQMQSTISTLEGEKRNLQTDAEKFKKIAEKERQEKLRLKQTLKDLTSNERLRWERECEKRVKEKELEMGGVIYQKSAKLKQLCEIVQGLDSPARSQLQAMNVNFEADEAPPTRAETQTSAAKREAPTPVSKPPRGRVRTAAAPKMRAKSPPEASNAKKAAVNPRELPLRTKAHRRSRSSDYWVEHKPTTTLNTDTILQPMLMNKTTVKVPGIGDLKNSKRYLLTHQEQDSGGEIETKLIKGDVMKTRGGGHSVQFTDVETLRKRFEEKQKRMGKTRGGRKRTSEESAASSEDSWTSVETRCAVGIEGRPGTESASRHIKKPKT